jgi:hypothetical protein
LGTLFFCDTGQIHTAVLHDMFLNFLSQFKVGDVGEQPAWDFFGETLFLVVWVADRHVQNGLLETLVFALWMRLDHNCGPYFEAFGCEAGYVGPFLEVVKLDKMVLRFYLSEEP